VKAVAQAGRMEGVPFPVQVGLLTRRFVQNLLRQPAVLLPNLGIPRQWSS
jgi:hypothetical protein